MKCPKLILKIQPPLELDDSSGKRTLCPTKVRVINQWRKESERFKIQVVKDIEGGRFDFQKCSFT